MHMTRLTRALGLALAALLAVTGRASAQVTTGAITGVVTDETGQPVEAAQIQMINKATGLTRGALTGASGRFVIGSTADKLLHSAGVPVAVAPAGYARTRQGEVGKIVVCFQNTAESRRTLSTAADYSARTGVPLEVLTILLRHRIYASNLGADAEGPMLASLRDDAAAAVAETLANSGADVQVESTTVTADSVQAAMERTEWEGDELLVMGSAVSGPVRRVFLGDMTYKLLRSTPVPAIVLPRHD